MLPQKTLGERGYKGRVYQTHGIATWDFLRVGGKDVEGTLFPTGPVVVARQLPDSHPVKKVALDFAKRYEVRYGADSVTQFAGDAWGAWMLLDDAARRALKSGAQPGTREFRRAMRDAIESTAGLTIPNGVMNMSANDHRLTSARVMGVIRDGSSPTPPGTSRPRRRARGTCHNAGPQALRAAVRAAAHPSRNPGSSDFPT